jgi:hypothetical protein
MSCPHTRPAEAYIEKNKKREPEGERIRKELIEFLERNKIATMLVDTAHHTIEVNIDKLPHKMKQVLSKYGCIMVVDDEPDWKLGDAVPEGFVIRNDKLEWVPPERPEGWDDNVIPPMTNPLGKYWTQPGLDEVVITDKTATMTQDAFDLLHEYSSSMPTGAYEGKMWKARRFFLPGGEFEWALIWYGYSKIGPGYVSNNYRGIVIREAANVVQA